jgi:beta-galactosidase
VLTNRRRFLHAAPAAALPLSLSGQPGQEFREPEALPLNGDWEFRVAPEPAWRTVTVPHTWQVEAGLTEHYGQAGYRRRFFAPARWAGAVVRIEFEAVYHSARVRLNGQAAGEHQRAGYTPFTLDLTRLVKLNAWNELEVEVDNSFDEQMLPRGKSSDWAHDGGITRPVTLLVTPQVYIEHLWIDASPAKIAARAVIHNAAVAEARIILSEDIRTEAGGVIESSNPRAAEAVIPAGQTRTIELAPVTLAKPRLWHFDDPFLYRARVALNSGDVAESTFGIRTIEIRGTEFVLNGEPVRLMGVERMAGSNPEFGMAEPREWIDHDHADMRALNCIYTRTHWPQDRRLLDYCDRHGILIQTEVPGWGPRTFQNLKGNDEAALLANGMLQLREMIADARNHPCIFSWGVCNEVNGQNPPAQAFIRALYKEAKRLDPARLVTYASHSLFSNPGRDVAGEMDYIMFNQYFGSWQKGGTPELEKTLDALHAAFPGKPLVISEYGYCACTDDRPENDPIRIGILESQDKVFRERPWIAGLIFFCYNDYRTHIGDKGEGALKQRVHGVVDLYGARKPSWDVLRRESSPVESLTMEGTRVTLRTRGTVPAHTLRGYTLRAIAYGRGAIPLAAQSIALPDLPPGATHTATLQLPSAGIDRVTVEVLRGTGEAVMQTAGTGR